MTENKTIDPASQCLIDRSEQLGITTAWDRNETQIPRCGFGILGICCKVCDMGPCRIDPFGEGAQRGVCGADADIIAARQLIRQIACGAAAHSDHGRDIARTLLLVSQGKAEGYEIKGKNKLFKIAKEWNISTDGKKIEDIAKEVAITALNHWGQQEGEVSFPALRAPQKTVDNWRKHDLIPRGIDREIVETLHRTHEGVDADYKNIIMFGLKTSMSDGWAGSMIATELGDILFGEPKPIRSKVNLGVLDKNMVNIVVHGHEPTLSEMIVNASHDSKLLKLAEYNGARGINVVGICCTANEVLMRQGVSVLGNFLNQELAIITGVVEAMVVDVQCIMPALSDLSERFHTKLITTSSKARIRGAQHIQFNEEKAYTIAKEIVKMAVENFKNRREECIPPNMTDLIAGFTVENLFEILGGKYRASFRPLNDAIISGRIRGIAAVVGCNTIRKTQDRSHIEMVKELLKNDVLVVTTGCAATACAKIGLLQPESANIYAGKGIQEICKAVGIPPVLHLGSCVDNSRILVALCEIIKEGGLGEALSDLPVAAAAPEAMCEKAISIAFYAVASGCFVAYSPAMRVVGSKNLTEYLTKGIEEITGGKFCFEDDPVEAARRMIDHIDIKRNNLKLNPPMYDVPYKKYL